MNICVLGAGQLSKMLALCGVRMGMHFHFVDCAEESCARDVGTVHHGDWGDAEFLRQATAKADIVTYEFENIPIDVVRSVEAVKPVSPSSIALALTQDRVVEKTLAAELGIPTPAWMPADDDASLRHAIEVVGLPCVCKTRSLGYDGKGQVVLRTHDDIAAAAMLLRSGPGIVEAFVPFSDECSFIAARGADGDVRCFPPTRNVHRNGILHTTALPCSISAELVALGQEYLHRFMQHCAYVGVCTMECFVHDGQLLFNEFAPRVHNSGHWTIEGASVSQFEQHVRAIAGLPLGDVEVRGYWGMVNVVGDTPVLADVLRLPGVHVHLYGKRPMPGRKLGHITVSGDTSLELQERMSAVEALLPPPAA